MGREQRQKMLLIVGRTADPEKLHEVQLELLIVGWTADPEELHEV